MTRPGRGELLRLVVAVLFFTAAPTAGDIGSCGQSPDDLDPKKFFANKAEIDCKRCAECGLGTAACDRSCNKPPPDAFPAGCYPVVHDGEVCLDTLRVASCGDYTSYEADEGATAPTECNFCPPAEKP
jgi:hypothetical protein